MDIPSFILFGIFAILLIVSGFLLIKSLSTISKFLRLSEFVIGSIVLAFATSIPEFFIGVTSALVGKNSISLGNVIGANLLDMTLVIGIPILIARNIHVGTKTVSKDSLMMLTFAFLPIVLMLIGNKLSRIDGAILVISFLFYIKWIFKKKKVFSKKIFDKITKLNALLSVAIFIFSLFLLFYSAKNVVDYAVIIAEYLNLPKIFIGLFLISFGTTLPELIASSNAAITGHKGITLGNIIGSVIFNSSIVLGVSSLINPIEAEFSVFLSSSVFMLFAAFLFVIFLESGKKLTWKEGIALILFYILFLILEVNAKGILF